MLSSQQTKQPEDAWLETNQAVGLIVRLHALSKFQVTFLSAIDHQGKARISRRVFQKKTPAEFVPTESRSFACNPSTVKRLLGKLNKKGILEIKDFFDEEDASLDGLSLDLKYGDERGNKHQATLFNWESSRDKKTQEGGRLLHSLVCSSLRTLKVRAFLKWWW